MVTNGQIDILKQSVEVLREIEESGGVDEDTLRWVQTAHTGTANAIVCLRPGSEREEPLRDPVTTKRRRGWRRK